MISAPGSVQTQTLTWQYKAQGTRRKPPILLVHFDVNKTVYMADPATQKDYNYVVISALAEDKQYADEWEKGLGVMTYHEYIANHRLLTLKGTAEHEPKLRAAISQFVQTLAQSKHRFYPAIKKRHDDCTTKLKALPSVLVPSFIQSIKWLMKNKQETSQDFRLLIRTFGHDRDIVMRHIFEQTGLTMVPSAFDTKGHYSQKKAQGSNVEIHTQDLHLVYENWLNNGQHVAVNDCYHRWSSNQEAWEYGKPLPFERSRHRAISLIFDDNIKTRRRSRQNIIAPFEVTDKTHVPVGEIMKQGTVFVVDPLSAIEDDDYFIAKIQAACGIESVVEQTSAIDPNPKRRKKA